MLRIILEARLPVFWNIVKRATATEAVLLNNELNYFTE
jgi:hypothetical protein